VSSLACCQELHYWSSSYRFA